MNEQVFKETIANEFPDEDMLDKTFRDKVMMMIMSVTLFMILIPDARSGEEGSNIRRTQR